MQFIINLAIFCTVMIALPAMSSQETVAENAVTTVKQSSISNKTALVIKSQVKGSQEQPNVTYIMPWQGIKKPVSIQGDTQKIVLPNFKPINPKLFKKQARLFYKINSTKRKKTSTEN